MVTKIQKWGNSQGLRIAKQVLEDAQIKVGDEVEVEVRDGQIVIAPATRIRGRHRLEDLVAAIPEGVQPEKVEWGDAKGKEVW